MATRVDILAVGSLHGELRPAAHHYLHLLRPLIGVSVREVKEAAQRGRSRAEVLREEGRRLVAAWPRTPLVVALAVDGRTLSSEAFADWLQAAVDRGGVGFVVGGPLGLSDDVVARVDDRLSLSSLTLPHQLARVVLLEQLFRAAKIARGETYHH